MIELSMKIGRKYAGAGVEQPVGTIVIRRHNRSRARYIKVSMRGPQNVRWRPYARWWWENHRGPIPVGKRVLHVDGDTLNDDPSNLVLGTADDVLMLSRDWDPGLDDRNRRNAALATAECNRVRSQCRRLREYLPSRWYPVDFGWRIVVNSPHRHRRDVWPESFREHWKRNGRGAESAAIGFPSLPVLDAILLASLIDRGHSKAGDLIPEIVRRRRALSLRSGATLRLNTFYSTVSRLKSAGLVRSIQPPGEFHHVYFATALARERRTPGSSIVPVRGDDLEAEEFRSFLRWTPGVNDDERQRWVDKSASSELRTVS